MIDETRPESSRSSSPSLGRFDRGLWAAVSLALSLWIFKVAVIAFYPLRKLVMTAWLSDDAFIFMRIARNVALGRGYSFDGERLTSGAPLLWVWLTLPWQMFLNRGSAAKATLMTSGFFGALSTVVVFWIADKLFGRLAAWVAFVLSALSLPLVLNGMNGMETSVFTFLGLLAVALYLRVRASRSTWRGYLLLGCLLGLLHLTRTDGIFLTFAVLLAEFARLIALAPEERRHAAGEIAALVVGAAILTVPVLVLTFSATGKFAPANQVGRRALAWQAAAGADGRISIVEYAARSVFQMLSLQRLISIATGSSVLTALVLFVAGWRGRGRLLARIIGVYAAGFFGALVFYQWYFPDVHGLRYLNLPSHLVAVLTAGFLTYVVRRVACGRLGQTAILTVVVALTLGTTAFQYRELTSSMDPVIGKRLVPSYSSAEVARWWQLIDWMAVELEPGTVVAATDHGRIAYFTDVKVLDLDGILLPEIIRHLEEGSVESYFDENEVEYVLLPNSKKKLICRYLTETGRVVPAEGVPPDLGRVLYYWKPPPAAEATSS